MGEGVLERTVAVAYLSAEPYTYYEESTQDNVNSRSSPIRNTQTSFSLPSLLLLTTLAPSPSSSTDHHLSSPPAPIIELPVYEFQKRIPALWIYSSCPRSLSARSDVAGSEGRAGATRVDKGGGRKWESCEMSSAFCESSFS